MNLPRTLVLVAVILNAPVSGVFAEDSIEGVWQVTRIDRDYNPEANASPQPGIIIFTETHYSMVMTFGVSAMRAYSNRWAGTDEEKLRRYGELMVNSGTYKLFGSQLETIPIAAKDPDLIGGIIIYGIDWSDSNLVLTYMDEYSHDNVQYPGVERSGGKLHLTLTRISE